MEEVLEEDYEDEEEKSKSLDEETLQVLGKLSGKLSNYFWKVGKHFKHFMALGIISVEAKHLMVVIGIIFEPIKNA